MKTPVVSKFVRDIDPIPDSFPRDAGAVRFDSAARRNVLNGVLIKGLLNCIRMTSASPNGAAASAT